MPSHRQPKPASKTKSRPRFWLSLLLIMVALVLLGTGQWDMLVAVFIGLLVGNAAAFLFGDD